MRELKVDAIKNGTVIDHIDGGKALEVAEILKLCGDNVLMIGLNLTSGKHGKKDIIKLENHELSSEEVNSISIIAPEATLSIIRDYAVVKKKKVQIPDYIEGIIVCPNPKCVTNMENLCSKFNVTRNKYLYVRCCYCEKKYKAEEVKIKI